MNEFNKQRLHQKIYGKELTKKPRKYLRRSYIKKKVADKRVVENEIYRKRRKSYLANHKFCQCGCGRYATQIHHKRGKVGKYRGESLLIAVKFFMAVSDPCHRKIENNPEWAKTMGYSLKRNIKTEKQPIMKKATIPIIVFLIALFAQSFTQQPAYGFRSYVPPDKVLIGYAPDAADTTKKKQDTIYYMTGTLPWFELLFKSVKTPDSVDQFQKAAILSWIINVRPILPVDSTKPNTQNTTPKNTKGPKPKSQ